MFGIVRIVLRKKWGLRKWLCAAQHELAQTTSLTPEIDIQLRLALRSPDHGE